MPADTDPRFTLANERTLLAWQRTALAFVAAGFAVIQFLDRFDLPGGRRLIGLPLILFGSALALAAGRQWHRREAAIRAGEEVPASRLGWYVTAMVAVTGVAATVVASTGLARP